jgi:hypothetical protein
MIWVTKKGVGKYGLEEWLKQFRASVLDTSASKMFSSKHKGIISQTARVEAEHPTYLHEHYQCATTIIGDVATFNEIATQINLLSMDDKMPTMNLNKWSLQRWFKKNKGKEKRPVFRPMLTEAHKASRLKHAE